MMNSKLNIGVHDNGTLGSTATIDMGQSFHKMTLGASVTLTFTAPVGPTSGVFIITQDGTGGRVVTWPATATGQLYVNLTASASTVLRWVYDGTNYVFASGSVPQAVNNVNDTTPTAAELTTSFGAPSTLGRGFIGTVDDADGNTNGYIVWCSDASFYFLKGTKAT